MPHSIETNRYNVKIKVIYVLLSLKNTFCMIQTRDLTKWGVVWLCVHDVDTWRCDRFQIKENDMTCSIFFDLVICFLFPYSLSLFHLQTKLFWCGERKFGNDWVELVNDVVVGGVVWGLVLDSLKDSHRANSRKDVCMAGVALSPIGVPD